jgi:alpha-tubulin suppressor-like RCC1 family protein
VSGLASGVTAIAAGADHNLAIRAGALFAWGFNTFGQLGDGTNITRNISVPVSVLTSGVTAIAGGNRHSLAVQNGNVFAWGNNAKGQLGDGTATNRNIPTQVPGLSNIVAVAASSFSSFALASDGSLWVWGDNAFGELGLGNNTSFNTPQHLFAPSGYLFTSIDAEAIVDLGDHIVVTLTVVPEPTSLALMLVGLGVCLGFSIKRLR